MNKLKRFFGIPWVIAVFLTSLHTAAMLIFSAHRLAWVGAAFALWPVLVFFGNVMRSGKGRSPVVMRWPLISAVVGTLIVMANYQTLPFIYAAILSVVGIILYDFWYSIMPARQNNKLGKGLSLPVFTVKDTNGKPVSSQQWAGKPLLLMFIRGNWCPLCVAQVSELAAEYQKLSAKGIRIVIVSAQPQDETRQLAEKFSVPFEFYSDLGGKAAAQIGIQHEQGSPLGMVRYSTDTVIPTVVICDAKGMIQYIDVADNYRHRPEPALILEQLGI